MTISSFFEPGDLEPVRPRGRPVRWDIEIAMELCERLGNGEKLHDVCKDPRMPSAATVFRWKAANHENFAAAYDCALMAKFELKAEELIAIADDAANDYVLEPGDEGEMPTLRPNKELLARTEIRLRERKWVMAKALPRIFGKQMPQPVAPPPVAEAPTVAAMSAPAPATIAVAPVQHQKLLEGLTRYRVAEAKANT